MEAAEAARREAHQQRDMAGPFATGSECRLHDFVTGLMSLNRSYEHFAELPAADRDQILFGSDFVVP